VQSGAPDAGDAAVSLVFVAFAYSGFNAAAYVAGELRDPGRTLPRALLLGTSLVVTLYLALNVAFFYAAEPATLARDPEVVGDVAARALFGDRVSDAMSALIALGLVSSVSAMVMVGPRVTMAMADDGLFFRAFARRGPRGAPWVSVAAQSAIALVLLYTATFEGLLTYIGFTLSAFSALTVLGAVRLRAREPDAPRPYRAFGWPLTPALFLALATFLVAFSIYARPLAAAAGALTLAAGLALYAAWAPK
jgi:basic amino acid/polyamine antiporter, APA family